ncbi:putative Delta(5) fatty acid desaturase C [Tetrabaena socialis]|uniref:Putative Delta(5) fatty acid desaturase C n=1 Tax=Tetrabaena socialis TaxID=47790 RepID=A0A2J8A358_9CHLO|nr:putative Delta(5) fatty acid desaturase C [Tetrabaena socialis]|eukprot:PNH06950.1 putative Delta(5) fatty acid desaturase C [Tetrabaena socialis]
MCQLRDEVSAPPTASTAGTSGQAKQHTNWIIAGQAYDLAKFVKHHPGGVDAILLGRGRDCTELFEQYHVLNDKHLRVLERYRMPPTSKAALGKLAADGPGANGGEALVDDGEADVSAIVGLQQPASRTAYQVDPFYEDVKAMVRAHGNIKMSTPFVILHCLHVLGLVYALRLWYQGSLVSAFLLPTLLWLFGAAMVHDGGHFALSHKAGVNKFLNFTAALITNSTGCWYLQHNILHHSYTNLHGQDGDLDSHHPYMRIHPEQSIAPTDLHHALRCISHLFMYVFAHIGLTMISPVSYFRGLAARRKGTADAKVEQDTYTLSQFHSGIVLQESYLWSYLTIGLNMQSLHHIVPGVSYSQLTSMYPKYRAICAKHGIRLLERRSLAHALATHVQTLWVLSKKHSFAEVSRKLT